MESRGRVIAISISTEKGIPKTNVPEAEFVADWGIRGDAHAGQWHRQVSLLATESIEKMRALGLPEVSAGDFAENITTAGVDLLTLKVGDKLSVGEAELEITQIGKECHSHCAIFDKVGDCVMPREGLFAKVLAGGKVRVGDSLTQIIAR
jgi:cyclic pyranopterin monophosphate synthase